MSQPAPELDPTDGTEPGPAAGEAIAQEEQRRLKRRAAIGVVFQILRTVAQQLIVLGGMVVLARLLSPGDFGVYAIVQFALSFFQFFADAGVGASLIQQQREPSDDEVASVFGIQTLLSAGLVAVACVLATYLHVLWPGLPESAPWLLRALSISLLFSSLQVPPHVFMMRKLQFGKLAIIDTAQSTAFYLVAIALAFWKPGVWVLVAALLAQSFVSVALSYALHWWRPRFGLDWKLLAPMVRYGVQFQLKAVWGFVNGAIIPVWGGARLGARSVGLIEFGMNTAWFPVKLVEILSRVSFPLLARLKGDAHVAARVMERGLQVCALGTYACVAIFFGLGPQIIHVIYGDKWLPALDALWVYSAAIGVGFASPLLAAGFDARGEPQHFARLMFVWVLLDWTLTPIGTHFGGLLGFVLGHALHIVIGNVMAFWLVRKLTPEVRIWRAVRWPLVAGAITFVVSRAASALAPKVFATSVTWTPLTLTLAIVGLVVVFLAVVLSLDRELRETATRSLRARRLVLDA